MLTAKKFRWHPGVDAIGEPVIAFPFRLDNGGGVNAGRRPKCILAEHGIVRRDRHPGSVGDDLAHLAKLAEVRIDPAEQSEVHQQQVQVGVAHAFAKTERAAMDSVGAGDGGLDRVDDAEAAVAMPVPVEPNVGLHLV